MSAPGRVVLNDAGTTLVVSFRFDRTLKDFVKSLPGMRFDWTSKTWQTALEHAPRVVPPLRERGFEVASAVAQLAGVAAVQASHDGEVVVVEDGPGAPRTLAVSELNHAVARAVGDRFPAPVWVVGVLQSWEKNRPGAHAYCKLAEIDDAGRVRSVVGAVAFRAARGRIERAMSRAGLELVDGLPVRFVGRVDVYEARGSYQLVIDDIDTSWSAGDLTLRRDKVLAEIRGLGLADRQLGLTPPILPLRVALLTSAGSDAYHDFVSSLSAARYPFAVTLYDVRVQGAELAPTVCAALSGVRASAESFDLVVITRGGGSRVELAGWDDLGVARAVAELPVKVLVAIGHHQDRSVLDEIAWSAKTPTEAGEVVVSLVAQCEERIERSAERLLRASERELEVARRRLVDRARQLVGAARHAMAGARSKVEREYPRCLVRAVRERLRAARGRVDRGEHRLRPERIVRSLVERRLRLDRAEARLSSGGSVVLARARVRAAASAARCARLAPRGARDARRVLDSLDARLRLCDPRSILGRGYAIVRDSGGAVVSSARAVVLGGRLGVELSDGVIEVHVNKTPQGGDGG